MEQATLTRSIVISLGDNSLGNRASREWHDVWPAILLPTNESTTTTAEVAEGGRIRQRTSERASGSQPANRAGPAVDISLNDSGPADVCVDLETDIISISRVVVVVAIGGVSLAAAGPWR